MELKIVGLHFLCWNLIRSQMLDFTLVFLLFFNLFSNSISKTTWISYLFIVSWDRDFCNRKRFLDFLWLYFCSKQIMTSWISTNYRLIKSWLSCSWNVCLRFLKSALKPFLLRLLWRDFDLLNCFSCLTSSCIWRWF